MTWQQARQSASLLEQRWKSWMGARYVSLAARVHSAIVDSAREGVEDFVHRPRS